MAFGYRYWLVYLLEVRPGTFLLFTHNPKTDGTELRDYSTEREMKVGTRRAAEIYQRTHDGTTRLFCDEHRTDDVHYWHRKTMEANETIASLKTGPLPGSAG